MLHDQSTNHSFTNGDRKRRCLDLPTMMKCNQCGKIALNKIEMNGVNDGQDATFCSWRCLAAWATARALKEEDQEDEL
jgi:hypothetical protein